MSYFNRLNRCPYCGGRTRPRDDYIYMREDNGNCNCNHTKYDAMNKSDYFHDYDYNCSEYDYNLSKMYSSKQVSLKDYGPDPFVINIEEATLANNNYRTALWTGKHLQLTLMSIGVGEDIGLEIHPNLDQFIRIEQGQGFVKMGDSKDKLDFQEHVYEDYIFIIPAGKWHNLINTGNVPIKLYSIYAPPQHPHGTVHRTRAEAEESEHHNH